MARQLSRVHISAAAMTALVLPTAGLAVLAAPAQAVDPQPPSVRLIAATDTAQIYLSRRGSYELDLPLFLASTGGPFELWAQRPTYDDPVILSQVTRDLNGDIASTSLVTGVPEASLSSGMPAFLNAELTRKNGTPVKDAARPYCPMGWSAQRIDDTGPAVSRYPSDCWASPFTRGAVWGIDQGWAAAARASLGRSLRVDPGTYKLTVSIAEPYRTAFGVAAQDASVTVPATVMDGTAAPHRAARRAEAAATTAADQQAEPISLPVTVPPDSALPDIEALPAWGIRVENKRRSGRSFMNFGATAWNAGPGILAVEGFREPASTTMDAFQYFYEDDVVVGKVPAGQLEYDNRDGHDHWHFRDFAAYSLLDADKNKVLDSGKEAFCLAPTDPIDLTVDGADWHPWLADLGTACGQEESLWIREVLETGWGDTYAQYRPGQSFEITDLPNGAYYIRVLANPDNVLLEGSAANNEVLRKVKLHGKAGQRWVEVPAYGLIDSENSGCGSFC